jgi:hypothetical protein
MTTIMRCPIAERNRRMRQGDAVRETWARKRAAQGTANVEAAAAPVGITRRCLCCRERFQAEGRSNRICLPCQAKPWFSDGIEDLSVSTGRRCRSPALSEGAAAERGVARIESPGMCFDNRLTDDDLQRVHGTCPNPPPALLMAGSFAALLEAIDIYTQESVHRVTSGMLGLTDREKVILGLYYRSVGFCRTAIELKSVIHQQSLTSAGRSVG